MITCTKEHSHYGHLVGANNDVIGIEDLQVSNRLEDNNLAKKIIFYAKKRSRKRLGDLSPSSFLTTSFKSTYFYES